MNLTAFQSTREGTTRLWTELRAITQVWGFMGKKK